MTRHLLYFRPGEEARMLARCQFGLGLDGKGGATLTYPIKGMPWRRNIMKNYAFNFSEEEAALLFSDVHRIRAEFPAECLSNEQLWSDSSEKANGITRDRKTGTLCYSIAIYVERGNPEESYALRENSEALLESTLHRTISALIAPYEKP
jgi:hypothetical protein